MKTNDLITIIVPVYNVENYLRKCLNSIVKQTYKNVEIILIDDGSTDESGKICDEYIQKHTNLRVIHKENEGVSVARNLGISEAKGKYIIFIDGDDYIERKMIEKLYNVSITKYAQIACCGKILESGNKIQNINNSNEFCVDSKQAIRKFLLLDDIDASCSDKLIDITLFKNIKYPVNRRYEDMATMYKLLYKAKKIAHINYLGYHYVKREDSFINVNFDERHFDMITYSKEIKEFIYEKYPDFKKEADSYYYLQLFTILRKINNATNKMEYKNEYRQIKKEYNNQIFKILSNKYVPVYKKIMAICIYFNLYKIINILKKYKRNKK